MTGAGRLLRRGGSVRFALSAVIFGSLVFLPVVARGNGTLRVSVHPPVPAQGDPVLIIVTDAQQHDNLVLVWKGKEFLLKGTGAGRHIGIVGVDLLDPPGKMRFAVEARPGGSVPRFHGTVKVAARAFPVQRLTLKKEMAEFDEATLARIRREEKELGELFARPVPGPLWDFPFLPPVADFRPSGFGARRVINGEERSPHAGVDVFLPAGTPVMAVAPGIVAFAGERFFGGNSVVLDHGGGLFSVYYHLRDVLVAGGKSVDRGEKIGTVGSSGRATGPHLHFGVRAGGGRVDPGLLFGLGAD